MKPIVSIILPVYNEENNLHQCLESIVTQDFDANAVEILVVDDDSTDNTIDIAGRFPVIILRNGKKDYDIGKAIGVNRAAGKFLLFIDADNRLTDRSWIRNAVKVLRENRNVVGIQSWKFEYSRKSNAAIRYTSLFGNTDPVVYYLKMQDHLGFHKDRWDLRGEVMSENDDYMIASFPDGDIPTLGSQGFMTRKEYFDAPIEQFQHVEFCIELLRKKNASFCFLKNAVAHEGFSSIGDIIRKLSRNMDHYMEDSDAGRQDRYSMGMLKILKVMILTQTLIVPVYDSVRGYVSEKDSAWFIHIVLSFIIPWIYAFKIGGRFLKKRFSA